MKIRDVQKAEPLNLIDALHHSPTLPMKGETAKNGIERNARRVSIHSPSRRRDSEVSCFEHGPHYIF